MSSFKFVGEVPDKLVAIGKVNHDNDDEYDGLGDDGADGEHEDDDNGDDASGGQVVVPGALVVVGSRALGPGRHQLNGLSCLKVKTFPTGFRREHSTVLVFLLLLLLLQTFRCGSTTTPRRGS